MKRTLRVALVLLVVAAVAAITYLNRVRRSSDGFVQKIVRERVPVRTLAVAPRTLVESLERTGVVQPRRDVTITADVGGKVAALRKHLGDGCRKGEMLLKIDQETYRIAHAQAEAQLRQSEALSEQAGRDLARTKQLAERSIVAEQALDQARTALTAAQAAAAQARAALELAARNLRETTVRCPFGGAVAETFVEIGQRVAPQAPLIRLVDARELKLVLSVSAEEFAALKEGQRALLYAPERPGVTFEGGLARLGVAADPATRNFPVEVTVAGGAEAPLPGQVVHARIEIAKHASVLALPDSALHEEGGNPSVLLAQDGKAKRRAVTLGARAEGMVVITSGLRDGDQVIISGNVGLKEGSAIKVVDTGEAPATSSQAPARTARRGLPESPPGASSAAGTSTPGTDSRSR